jgi:hypothetical protein
MALNEGALNNGLRINGARLRRIRESLDVSQTEFAELVREAGRDLGEPNTCSKRLVQKWEAGGHSTCRPNYRRALSRVTGMTYDKLCEPLPTAHAGLPVGGQTLRAVLDQVIEQLEGARERLV